MSQAEHFQKEREYWTSKVAEYAAKLRHAEKKRDEAMAALAQFKVGQEVEYSKRGTWVPALVRGVEPNTWGCYFRVSLKKKNGDWSAATERAFSVTDLREVEAAS